MSEWQPIETAPKDGTEMLLFAPTWATQVGILENLIVIGFWVTDWGGNELGWDTPLDEEPTSGEAATFTYWMPLPAPPK